MQLSKLGSDSPRFRVDPSDGIRLPGSLIPKSQKFKQRISKVSRDSKADIREWSTYVEFPESDSKQAVVSYQHAQ